MKSIGKMVAAGVVLACVVLAPIVIAAEGMGSTPSTSSGQASSPQASSPQASSVQANSPQVVGEWEFKSKFEGRASEATMTIKKTAEGKYEGTWSAQFGESTLSDITFNDGKLAFVQTSDFGGREMKTTYDAKVEGTKLTGTGKGQFGEIKIDGTLQGEPKTGADAIVGEWQINVTVPPREIVDKMIITKDANGMLEGKWTGQRGESTISNMKLEGNKLTFTRKSKMGEMEFEMPYEGTVEGDQIKGAFKSDFGEREANATRVGAAKAEAGKAEPNKPAIHRHMGPEPNKPK